MLTIGLVLGPLNHYWYHMLDKFLVGATGRIVAKKVLLDELIASPIFTTSFFVGKWRKQKKQTNAPTRKQTKLEQLIQETNTFESLGFMWKPNQ